MKQDHYHTTKLNHELQQEKVTLEKTLESKGRAVDHYKELYRHLTSSSRPSTEEAPVHGPSTSSSSPATVSDDEEDRESCVNNKEKIHFNETILLLEKEKQSLLGEVYELKKRNSDLSFHLKQKEMSYLSELDSSAVSHLSSTSPLGKYPIRKSMSVV
jgi:lipopolysaccharide biosynthesis protein